MRDPVDRSRSLPEGEAVNSIPNWVLKCLLAGCVLTVTPITVSWIEIKLGDDPDAGRLERIEHAVSSLRAEKLSIQEVQSDSQQLPPSSPPLPVPRNAEQPLAQDDAMSRGTPNEVRTSDNPQVDSASTAIDLTSDTGTPSSEQLETKLVVRVRHPMIEIRKETPSRQGDFPGGKSTLGGARFELTASITTADNTLTDQEIVEKYSATPYTPDLKVRRFYAEGRDGHVRVLTRDIKALSESKDSELSLQLSIPIRGELQGGFVIDGDGRVWTRDNDSWRKVFADELEDVVQ